MHYLYFVKVNKKEAENARQAIKKAQSVLEENSFAGTEGYWGGGKCDWFVMGGRWSGEFSGLDIKVHFFDEILKFVKSKANDGKERDSITFDECKKYDTEIQNLWLSLGGKNLNPYARDRYKHNGYDDDAVILTAEIIRALKKKHHTGVEYYDCDTSEEHYVSKLSKEAIGDWLVIVDYHG